MSQQISSDFRRDFTTCEFSHSPRVSIAIAEHSFQDGPRISLTGLGWAGDRHQIKPRNVNSAGVTLVEMLAAIALCGLIIVGIVTFVQLAEDSFAIGRRSSEAIQIARSCFQQIEKTLDQAFANEFFPGAVVIPRSVGGNTLPETLVVWCPSAGQPRNPDGLPYLDELIVFSVNNSRPNELRRYRFSTSGLTAAAPSQVTAWQALIDALKSQSPGESEVLTDRLRTFVINGRVSGAIRFRVELAPSESEWSNQSITWNALSWPQGLFGPNRGVRRVSVHTEIQLQDTDTPETTQQEGSHVFWHSHAFVYTLRKEKRGQ
jgi:type II secretory pathway pseudopilin PulG